MEKVSVPFVPSTMVRKHLSESTFLIVRLAESRRMLDAPNKKSPPKRAFP